jgi:hypothetical protein
VGVKKKLTTPLTLTLSRKRRGEKRVEKLFKDFLPIDGGGLRWGWKN